MSNSANNPLKGKSLVSLADLSVGELTLILDTAAKVKKNPGEYRTRFAGKTLAMIFQKPSLRTRVSFEAGMTQMGGHAIYLGPSDISIGKRETTEDIALVLSRMCDIIMARTFGHDIVVDLAKYATVPVINGLSDFSHPCQILADLQTVVERRGKLAGLRFTYLGDGNNVAHSILFGGALGGMHVSIVTPEGFEPDAAVVKRAGEIASKTGGSARVLRDVREGAKNADVLYTDVWAGMGQEADAERRKQHFVPYQLNMDVLKLANPDCVVLHCLPAHYGDEISYDVTRTKNSAIFDEAENRLHAQKALMLLLAGAA
ncbi:MAG TPA: ornithine carbamoyltransferase [Phycisphaerae bacterium]|nr:ornithine carbamoyltransferase [Phycisphaerae bacterium]